MYPNGDGSDIVFPITINSIYMPSNTLVIKPELMIPTHGIQKVSFRQI